MQQINAPRNTATGNENYVPQNPSPLKQNGDKLAHEILKTMIIDDVRLNAQKLKSTFMKQMEFNLEEMMDTVVDSLDRSEFEPSPLLSFSASASMKDKREPRVSGKFPEKEFKSRPSLLTELLEVPHFKTIHHIFIASLALFMINIVITELLHDGTIDLGIEGIVFGFGKLYLTLGVLIGMHIVTIFFVYPTFSMWSTYRQTLDRVSTMRLDYCALGAFLTFLLGFIFLPALVMWKNPLPPGSGAAVTMEQCRLLMKVYAFVRSNVPRALNFKKVQVNLKDEIVDHVLLTQNKILRNRVSKKNSNEIKETGALRKEEGALKNSHSLCPEYSKYLYFLYAPTLIYMDSYPRTRRVRWNYVAWNFGQVLGCTFYINFIVGRCVTSYFSKFGHPDHPMNISQLIHTIFSLMLPGIMTLVLSFFLLLHAWQNAFAEILRFGDRQFYKDWWNCSSFASYYRTWNIIVHDWLYTYVFKEAREFGLGKIHSAIPTSLVFLISSLFHEYILSFTFNFFFPVLLTLFGGFGFAFFFIRNQETAVGNVLMWMGLMSGTGIIFGLYGFEYFARKNCPLLDEVSAWDFFQPRSLSSSCGALVMSFN